MNNMDIIDRLNDYEAYVDAIDDAIAEIERLRRQLDERWISVDEQLPKNNCQVLLANNYAADLYEIAVGGTHNDGKTFLAYDSNETPLSNVTHWQSLPAPPAG